MSRPGSWRHFGNGETARICTGPAARGSGSRRALNELEGEKECKAVRVLKRPRAQWTLARVMRIALALEPPTAKDAAAEREFAERAAGHPAVEAAAIANEIAEERMQATRSTQSILARHCRAAPSSQPSGRGSRQGGGGSGSAGRVWRADNSIWAAVM